MKYETSINFDFNNTMSLMIREIQDSTDVLEFGPASGRLTKYLKEEKGCHVSIVEIDEDAGKIASQYAENAVIGNIEDYQWMQVFKDQRFDYILFADVLEHLYKPQEVLKKVVQYLKEDGKIIFSVPNVAHNSIIIDLLSNKFEYQETGLLDNTHIRFWTKEIIENVLEDCHLYVEKKMATYSQVGKNEFHNDYNSLMKLNINPGILKQRPYGELYQYLYVVAKHVVNKSIDMIQPYADYYFFQYFIGEDSYQLPYNGVGGNVQEDIDISDSDTKFRFDPLNVSCIIRINDISDCYDRSKKLEIATCNASGIYENIYVFNHDDPQVCIKTENTSKIHLDFDILDYDVVANLDLISDVMENRKNVIIQKENYICELREIISGHDREKKELKDIISQKEDYINEQREKLSDVMQERDEYKNFAQKFGVKILFRMYKKIRGIRNEKNK